MINVLRNFNPVESEKVGILTEVCKAKANISSDISVDLFINSVNANFLTGKAIENLVEKGLPQNVEEFESILNALYFLVAELEENYSHEEDKWKNSDIMRYIHSLLDNAQRQ